MSTFQVARRGESKQRGGGGGGGHNAEHMQVQEYHLYEHIPPSFLCFEQGGKMQIPSSSSVLFPGVVGAFIFFLLPSPAGCKIFHMCVKNAKEWTSQNGISP